MTVIFSRIAFWVPLLLWALATWQYAHAGIHIDTARDWAYALDIARGERFHLSGPGIAFAFHVGPLWFYLLALPLALGLGFAGVAWLVAFLYGAQFALASWLGRRWGGSAIAGALAASALTLPNWAVVQMAGVTHTILSVPALLAALVAITQWWDRPSARRAMLAGLACSIAIHAHPTTGLVIGVFALALLRAAIPAAQKRHFALNFFFGLMIPFMPYLLDLMRTGMREWSTLHNYAAQQSAFANALQWFDVLRAIVRDAFSVQATMLPTHAMLVRVSAWVWAVALLLSAFGWSRRLVTNGSNVPFARAGMFALAAIALIIASVILAAASREYVTFYMFPMVCTLAPLLIATGWLTLPRSVQIALIVALVALFCAWAIAFVNASRTTGYAMNLYRTVFVGKEQFAGQSAEGKTIALKPSWPQTAMPALAQFLCANKDATLHGPGVIAVDLIGDSLTRERCAPSVRMTLGGRASEQSHWLGVPCTVAAQDSVRTGSVCWHPRVRVLDSQALRAADSHVHPPRAHDVGAAPRITLDAQLRAGELLVITNHLMEWAQAREWDISASEATPLTIVDAAPWYRVVRCANCDVVPAQIRVQLRTPAPHAIDLSILSASSSS